MRGANCSYPVRFVLIRGEDLPMHQQAPSHHPELDRGLTAFLNSLQRRLINATEQGSIKFFKRHFTS